MKNFSKILVSVICLAAFFTSCVKEEIRIREEIQFDVNLTRAGASSSQQGDQIDDVMIWAFDVNDSYNCVGWRTYTAPDNTYNTISLHIPAKTCGTNGGTYRLVAVLNKSKFTDAAGNVIPLGRNTTYNDLISGKFVSSAVMNSAIIESNPGTPAVMPVSHWMDVDVERTNTHEQNTDNSWMCKSVDMPVYRTVAKSQFLMAKKGTNASFDLKVVSLKLINNAMPTDGMILSSVIGDGLSDGTATPKWDWNPVGVADENKDDDLIFAPTASTTQGVYTLVDATTKETANKAVTVSKSLENHPAPANGGTVTQDFLNANYASYDLIGSHFIYETTDVVPFVDNSATQPVATDKGYYYEVIYTVDGASYTRYVGINSQIVRNHDYQVRALVDAGGKLSLSLVVNEWVTPKPEEYNFQSEISVSDNKTLGWTKGSASEITIAGEKVSEVKLAPAEDNAVSNNKPYAVCTFHLATPVDAEWRAALVGGNINAFEFVDAEGNVIAVPSGNVGEAAEIRIRAKQATVSSNMEAYLDIVVVTSDGRTLGTVGALCDGKRQKITQYAN